MVNIALLGAGFAGRRQLECWTRVPHARVVGLWNRTAERGRSLAAEYGVPFYADLDELLASAEAEAVDIATVPSSHLALTRRAAAAGKHVLCQKPLAETYADCEALVAACEAAGVRLMANENFRWRPWYRAAKELVEGGELGRPLHLRLTFRESGLVAWPGAALPQLVVEEPYTRQEPQLVIYDMGPHQLDLVRWFFGEPQTIYAQAHKVTDLVAGEEIATLLLGYPDRTAVVELSYVGLTQPPDAQLDEAVLEGTEGKISCGLRDRLEIVRRLGESETRPIDTSDYKVRAWTAALAHFAACLEKDLPFETEGRDYLKTMALVFAAYESLASGQPVRLG
ncbi:MAG: Gfo/Idh/MocA family protein [Chloroflexota bacterium]